MGPFITPFFAGTDDVTGPGMVIKEQRSKLDQEVSSAANKTTCSSTTPKARKGT